MAASLFDWGTLEGVALAKQKAGFTAVDDYVRSGMKLGLGTGSTAIWSVRRVAQLVADGSLKDIHVVSSSFQTTVEARRLGLDTCDLDSPAIDGELDLYIDGADEFDPEFCLIKGGGAAQLREKVLAAAAKTFVVVADQSKQVQALGTFPLPVEVAPMALRLVEKRLQSLGFTTELRMAQRKAGPIVTDNGNFILDCSGLRFEHGFGSDPRAMEPLMTAIPGVIDVGLFTIPVAAVYLGKNDGDLEILKPE